MHIKFWPEDLKEETTWRTLYWQDNISKHLKGAGWEYWTGFMWLESGTNIGLKQRIHFINVQYQSLLKL
jgi:hypothetical protein